MRRQEDSFEEVKRTLEAELGLDVPAPVKPMNAYMRFFFERSCDQRSKGNPDWKKLTSQLAEEWKNLPLNKKDYYTKIFEIRVRERNALLEEYNTITHKKKPLAPYQRYVQKRYPQYAKQNPNLPSSEINKLIKKDWEKLSAKDRQKLENEYEREKDSFALKEDNSDLIDEYKKKLQLYHQKVREDKQKTEKKYGITKQNRARVKRIERQEQRKKRRAQRELQRQQRRNEVKAKKQQQRDEKQRKIQEEREERQREKDRQKEAQRAAKQKARSDTKKKQTVKKAVKAKVESKVSRSVSKSKPKAAEKPKKVTTPAPAVKVQKTKYIKKAAKPAKKVKKESKVKTKPKPKAKNASAKGGKRVKK